MAITLQGTFLYQMTVSHSDALVMGRASEKLRELVYSAHSTVNGDVLYSWPLSGRQIRWLVADLLRYEKSLNTKQISHNERVRAREIVTLIRERKKEIREEFLQKSESEGNA